MSSFCYLNGKIVPSDEAKVSVFDIGLLRGFGIYEGLITHNRKPFMLADHLARFHISAAKMMLKIPATDEEISAAINDLVERNVPKDKEALIRFILTGGTAVGVIEYNPETPTFYILVGEFTPLEERYLTDGCSLMVVDYKRELALIKSINYIEAVLLQKPRKEQGALEILYISDGLVYEGAGSNVFIVKNGTLITPKEGIVYGITRKVVLDRARAHFTIEERAVSTDELYAADEVFITGSFKEVVPVVRIGDKGIGNGKVGEATKKVIELFRAATVN
jgi:branched-subunit amino acid aminotransferase/4-amino-4-deoxychorismate lyase